MVYCCYINCIVNLLIPDGKIYTLLEEKLQLAAIFYIPPAEFFLDFFGFFFQQGGLVDFLAREQQMQIILPLYIGLYSYDECMRHRYGVYE